MVKALQEKLIVASPSATTPCIYAGSQPRLGAITPKPASSGSLPLNCHPLMGAFIGSTRLKLKVVTGTRSLPSVDADAMSLSQLGTFLPQ